MLQYDFDESVGCWIGGTSHAIRRALDAELARVRTEWNTVRLHAGIGYVTPDDEHHGRGPAIRRARAAGLKRARQQRIEHNRKHRPRSNP